MTDPTKSGSAGDSDTSGDQDGDKSPEPKNDIDALKAKNEELLKEKKAVQRRLDLLEKEKKDAEVKALKDKDDWKTLAEQREADLQAANEKLSKKETEDRDRAKLAAVLDAVGGRVDRKYWGLIDIDQVAVNPETGEVDKTSATKYANVFKSEHGILIKTVKGDGIVKDAPKGGVGSITHAEWLKLPAKEMAARLKDVWDS